jgi:hypothetical protein
MLSAMMIALVVLAGRKSRGSVGEVGGEVVSIDVVVAELQARPHHSEDSTADAVFTPAARHSIRQQQYQTHVRHDAPRRAPGADLALRPVNYGAAVRHSLQMSRLPLTEQFRATQDLHECAASKP